MQDRPIYISLNSDKEFLLFNQVQRQYNKTLRLNKNLVLSKKEIYLKLTENIYIYLDEKAIKDIKKKDINLLFLQNTLKKKQKNWI